MVMELEKIIKIIFINNEIRIKGFLKYLKGQEHVTCAVLKRDGKKWRVQVNGRKLEEGNWGKFVEEFDLQVGNLLVFSHEGNMEFEISIFDSSQCSRAEYMQEDVVEDEVEVDEEEEEEEEYEVEEEEDEYEVEEEEENEYEEDEDEDEEEEAKEVAIDDNEEENEYEEDEDKDEEEEAKEVAIDDNSCERSHFECTIGKFCLFRSTLFLPQQFALANGLTNKKCKLIISDERQRSWKLKTCSSSNPRARAYIRNGWRKFIAENCIKEGDRIKFEVVTNGKTPIWKFQVVTDGETPMRKFQESPSPNIDLSNKTSSPAEAAATTKKAFVQSHFECTIRQYCFLRGTLNVPKQFAIANGLTNKKCGLIVRDGRQRSWNLKLSSNSTQSYIGDEFHKFIAENCLKEGDNIMFEVITNGETPIWKFKVVTVGETPVRKFQDVMKKPSNMSPLNAQVSTSASGDDDHPYFVSTIKPYCIRKTEFYLPMDFATSNGLNKQCEMILKDEAERCWSVWLGRLGTNFGITRGWTKFRTENGLLVGDAYKFELIKNGEIPIAHFHCKYSAKVAKRMKQ